MDPFNYLYDDLDVDYNHIYFPPSDYEFAESLQLEETLIYSCQDLYDTPSPSNHKRKNKFEDEIVESSSKRNKSSSSYRICEICVEEKQGHEMFRVQNCSHSFCSNCISSYISMKLQQNSILLTCPTPDCAGVLDLDTCKGIIPPEVADRRGKVLTESIIPDTEKFYCPFKDCSAVMIQEVEMEEIRDAECLECNRLFCAQCRSPWHSGKTCSEFQEVSASGSGSESGNEDKMFKSLAKKKRWASCPKCKFYVSKIYGCPHIVCRCKYEFCYRCGKKWSSKHYECPRKKSR